MMLWKIHFSKNDNVSPMLMVDPGIHNLLMVGTAIFFFIVVGRAILCLVIGWYRWILVGTAMHQLVYTMCLTGVAKVSGSREWIMRQTPAGRPLPWVILNIISIIITVTVIDIIVIIAIIVVIILVILQKACHMQWYWYQSLSNFHFS